MKKSLLFILAVGVSLAPSALFASSVPLAPGTGTTLGPPTSTPAVAAPGATPLADTGAMSFAATDGAFSGTVDSQVYRDPTTGGLDFLYQVSNSLSSPDAIGRVTMTNFTGFTTAVNYVTSSGTVAPLSANRLAAGDTVGFGFVNSSFQDVLVQGASSYWMEIDTNATSYALVGTTNVIDGGDATITTYAPTASTPEPMSMGLLGIGFAGLGLLRFRARNKK